MGTRGRQRTKEDETMKNNTTRHKRKRMDRQTDRQTASFSGKKVRGGRNTAKQRERASDRARGAPE